MKYYHFPKALKLCKGENLMCEKKVQILMLQITEEWGKASKNPAKFEICYFSVR